MLKEFRQLLQFLILLELRILSKRDLWKIRYICAEVVKNLYRFYLARIDTERKKLMLKLKNKFLIIQENRNFLKIVKKFGKESLFFVLTLPPDLFSICHKRCI